MKLKYFFHKDPLTKKCKKNRLTCIIFSKDRACQLDSLLESITEHITSRTFHIKVLYKASSAKYKQGYDVAKNAHHGKDISWIEETDFPCDLKKLVSSLSNDDLLMFLVDDNIFIHKIDLNLLITQFQNSHLTISLRASQKYIKDHIHPTFFNHDDFYEWEWQVKRKRSNTWNYPFSVDGNIYHARRMQYILEKIHFSAPNSFESALHDYRKAGWIKRLKKIMASQQPVVVNNPLNRVQTEGETWHKDIDPAYINDKYLEGYKIDNRLLYKMTPQNTHHDFGLHLVKHQ